jgi:hypothetical protein
MHLPKKLPGKVIDALVLSCHAVVEESINGCVTSKNDDAAVCAHIGDHIQKKVTLYDRQLKEDDCIVLILLAIRVVERAHFARWKNLLESAIMACQIGVNHRATILVKEQVTQFGVA